MRTSTKLALLALALTLLTGLVMLQYRGIQ
jgi:hypothetical protein